MERLTFDVDAGVQSITPGSAQRFEGIAFSTSGNEIGIATSDANSVLLYRKDRDGRFERTPYCVLEGPSSRLAYPHDVSFSMLDGTELLAVAQRGGAIAIYEKNRAGDGYGPAPVFEIAGEDTKLSFSDGVAFVPPDNRYLAVCNLQSNSVSFYRRISRSPVRFGLAPVFDLVHPGFAHPDGLAFSACGRWLAVGNHGNDTVSIFKRRHWALAGGRLCYGPEPVTVIRDPTLHYPHSVAFSPVTNCLVVTNAGANYFSVYPSERHGLGRRWSQVPLVRHVVGPEDVFRNVNACNKMEGGPKGVAIHGNSLAVCSPEQGAKIYSFRERVQH